MIGIVDYGLGNLRSVYNAFDYLGANVKICKYPEDLKNVDRIVLPGVGAFKDCINSLNSLNFVEALNENTIKLAKPTLGICLGMQVMAKRSHEMGVFEGLGWFDAEIISLKQNDFYFKIPNIGWNEINFKNNHIIFNGLKQNTDFYFVHSYFMKCNDINDMVASYDLGYKVTASVCKDNIFATQFHPEKSQDSGLKLLSNFLKWNP